MHAVTVREVPELGAERCDSLAGVPGGRSSPLAATGSALPEFARGVVVAVAIVADEGPGIGTAAARPNMVRNHVT